MSKSIELAVLTRYLDGVATPEERAAVDAWVGPDPKRRAVVAQLEAAWTADAERLGAASDREAVWARLSRQVGLAAADEVASSPPRVLRLIPPQRPVRAVAGVARWAAAIAAVAAAGAVSWHMLRDGPSAPVAVASAVREYVTPRGQRASFRLTDGTEVMLNAESRLRVPVTFGMPGRPREVELEGQGYFTVVHDANRPFTVRTARGVARDLGTRFDIRAYPDEVSERVAVTEGEVVVRATAVPTAAPVSLRAGQMAAIEPAGRVTRLPAADLTREVAWTRGRLELRDVTLNEAARRLGRWYDLDVRITDNALVGHRVSGSYGDEPIAHVLTVLTAAVGARYEWRGRTVTVFPADGTP